MQAVAEIGRLQATLRRLGEVPRRTAVIAAPKLERLLHAQFRAGTDPYGRTWRALRPATLAKGRRPPPLTDEADLREKTRARANTGNRAGIRITLGAPYGYFHQVGFRVGRTMVGPRRILPQFGMPRTWSAVLRASALQAARQARRR